MRKFLLTILMSALFSGSVFADNLSVGTIQLTAGTSTEVSISLNNSKQYAAFQFDMVLPEGVSVASSDNGLAVSLTDRKSDHELYAAKIADNTYRVLTYSPTNATITGTEGALLNITLSADEGIAGGEKTGKVENLVYSEADAKATTIDNMTFTIQVESKSGSSEEDVDKTAEFEFKAVSKTGDYYYATFNNAKQAAWFPADKFEVFSAIVDGSDVVMKAATAQEGNYKVKKGEACIIRSKEQKAEYTLKNTSFDDISTMPADNDLKVAEADFTASRLKFQYKLGVKGGIVAFYRIASGTVKEGTIYIQAAEAADRLNLVFGGEATAIKGVNKAAENNDAIYNLNGIRVKNAQKGIFIQNGKKIVK